jgi:hypothetical protein
MTQTEQVHQYLREYGKITALEALRELGVLRLAARIDDLKKQGVGIASNMIEVRGRNGRKARVAEYRLQQVHIHEAVRAYREATQGS